MVSLVVHAVLGIAVVAWLVRSNPAIYRRPSSGPMFSTLEVVYLVVGVVSIGLGWYFNVTFVLDYGPDRLFFNPLWGDGSWAQYLELMFDNPAAGSAGADFTVANVVLLPLATIIDGRRRGIARPWLFFVATLFTSFSFGWAFYLATVERQRRLSLGQPQDPDVGYAAPPPMLTSQPTPNRSVS
ncbi:DUF2834 domain-containing protein [Nocardioides bizhenqiangii]|uniref:DUF2834 domain-containing protein n=1 Tax=Nocardioides bizhenqiangii TaxID=3095076 RepID=A0ABZ0ZQX7_9ACTN|nr:MULTISPECIES: DUF2834 domain-containing protein [unclassified Nocardioides]MDZ5619300.1 DUF2834 domain-containing protein [Nocardioides sp. HM23]WQQ26677.1 DUF2834 domain-containing protein [Nocardioides sp. HM61]